MTTDRRMAPVRYGDILLLLALLLLLFFLIHHPKTQESGQTFELFLADSLIYTDSLHTETCTLTVENHPVILGVTDTSVWFKENSCPEQICVHAKPITHTGEEIVCVPNRLVLKIPGERRFDADIIAR